MGKTTLKVVGDADPLENYEPLLLSTVELLDAYWPQCSELLEPVVQEAMDGELTVADMYQGIRGGRMYGLVAKDDTNELPDVALVLILEVVSYPQKSFLNITAIGGQQLDMLQSKFWKHVCSWAYMNGLRGMQAMVSPAMARIIGKYGFKDTYRVMRMPLTEM